MAASHTTGEAQANLTTTGVDRDALLTDVAQHLIAVAGVAGADGAKVALPDLDGRLTVVSAAGSACAAVGTHLPLDLAALRLAPAGAPATVVIDDWSVAPDRTYARWMEARGVRSSVLATVCAPNESLGLIAVHSRAHQAFDAGDAGRVRLLAQLVGSVVHHAWLERSVERHALLDEVTGIPNRVALERRLAETIASTGDSTEFAVIAIDIHGMADVNDALGHRAGDAVLADAARRLSGALPAAFFGRMAGVRFVAIVEGVRGEIAARRVAQSILDGLGAVHAGDGTPVRLSGHAGVVLGPAGNVEATELLRDADIALREANADDDRRIHVFTPRARERLLTQLRIERELAVALERDQLVLHYQPILSAAGGETIGVEALLRWRHPERGIVAPGEFIPVAEATGQIVEIGTWVLAETCRQIARWIEQDPEHDPPPVSVNLSARQLADRTLPGRLATALAATGIPASALTLELTESSVIDGAGDPVEMLTMLKRIGVKVLLDDFGTGYSSLAYLRRLPVDGLKIDRSFVQSIKRATDATPIIDAIVGMGHALGLTVVAEGIETEEQLTAVRAAGVDAVQGFLFARPSVSGRTVTRPRPASFAPGLRPLARTDVDDTMTLGAVARVLGVSPSTIRRLADEGALRGVRTSGGHRRFRRRDVQELARRRSAGALLSAQELPDGAMAATADLLARSGDALMERAARVTYDAWSSGWFASAAGQELGREWLAALGAAVRTGAQRDALEATVRFLDAAALAGARLAECSRFVSQLSALVVAELVRLRAPAQEVANVRRLLPQALEALLEHVDPAR
ncbi:EAL domain-containing protein [Conexibacter sp. CPCC 206217]|uniref:EAL domain-containing protein n=1 Tax=Conexibacter sp. CPCC 206217 TaxID=3064574 RepID=UPI0027254AC6|nr:EAL domain-containing protein [Conexibacter sp. CPCC 206217]MDO8212375.1 EAL domain-containing protein [Conexibacter sp. CPCC 206217]